MPDRCEDFELPPAIHRKQRLFVAGFDACSRGLDVPTRRVEMHVVLVVEDETLIRELVAEELEVAGYTIVIGNDADQAIAILEARQDIHLVFPTSTCLAPWMV
jgi:PleD family two-component response regulator